MYDTVYKVYKDYTCAQYVHSYLVGYYRSQVAADGEIAYLRKHEMEIGHHVGYRVVSESSAAYPDVVATWEREDRERKLAEEMAMAPIPLPRIRKRWPSLFKAETPREQIIEFNMEGQRHGMMSFARHISKRRSKRRMS